MMYNDELLFRHGKIIVFSQVGESHILNASQMIQDITQRMYLLLTSTDDNHDANTIELALNTILMDLYNQRRDALLANTISRRL